MKQLMSGNAAFARGAYEAGATVSAAYPGTPSTEITENLVQYREIGAQWSPNEKTALEVALGAAVGGARSLCSMKHVGLNVAADPLFTSAYTGVNGGLVIIAADDPGMHSSQNEQDSRYYARGAGVPMLEPSDSTEAKEFVKLAFDLSERYDTPVLVRAHTRISHSQSLVELSDRREVPLKPYAKDADKYVMMPAMARKRHVIAERRMEELARYAQTAPVNRAEYAGAELGVVTSGVVYQYVKEALPDASVFKLGMVWPLPVDAIRAFAARVKRLVVLEELEPFLEDAIRAAGIAAQGKALFGRQGEYSVNRIRELLAGERTQTMQAPELPARPPVMCAGCPHRAVFHVLGKLKLTACGDIGCYTLGALPPANGLDTCVCMGASIGMALGMEKARGREFARKLVAVIGDGTFIHSGITGIVDMVYNGATSTVIILDNGTTGMTGHQDHPATGRNAKGEPAPALDLERLLKALGVRHVRVVDPVDVAALTKIIKEETAREELSVIIARRPCALLDRTKRTPYVISGACKQCGACLKTGCPAIRKTDEGYAIDPDVCNACGLCANVCGFSAIGKAGE